MLYPELFKSLEKSRWNMQTDIPWGDFDPALLTDEQAMTIKMNCPSPSGPHYRRRKCLRDNQHDSDFSAFMSIWFYEEQKHSLVLMGICNASVLTWFHRRRTACSAFCLRPCSSHGNPDAAFLRRSAFNPVSLRQRMAYRACDQTDLRNHFRDRARHGGAYLRYIKKRWKKQDGKPLALLLPKLVC